MRIFHIVARSDWLAAEQTGEYRPAAFAQDGFVHFSFVDQVAPVANARYRDGTDLVVVEIESDAVAAPLRIEDCYEAGEEFPHIYGPIPAAARRATHGLTRTEAGDWSFSPDAAGGAASTDR